MEEDVDRKARELETADPAFLQHMRRPLPDARIIQILEPEPEVGSIGCPSRSRQGESWRSVRSMIRKKWSRIPGNVQSLTRPAVNLQARLNRGRQHGIFFRQLIAVIYITVLLLGRRSLTRFLLVGASGLVVNSAVLALLYQGLRLPLILASPLSVEMAIGSNFILNDRWTFGRNRPSLRRFAMFNLTMLGVMLVTSGTVWLLVVRLRLPYLLANLLSIGAAALLNFTVSAAWIWGRKA